MKILVTGASGLLGAELCSQLKSKNYEVWAVDNRSRGKIIPICNYWLEKDLTDALTYNSLPTDFDYIYHYGAINGTKNFYEKPNTVLDNNFSSDVLLFKFAERCKNLKNLVYASSSEIVVGDFSVPTPESVNVIINDIHNPRWSYRLAKICSENYIFNSNIPWIICRYFNVYGKESKEGHFVADQIRKLVSGEFTIIGPDETRSFCYVSDAMSASIQISEMLTKEVVNIGDDKEIKILDAANIIANELNIKDPQWILKPSLAGSTPRRCPDLSKLKKYLPNYNPISFQEGIQKVL